MNAEPLIATGVFNTEAFAGWGADVGLASATNDSNAEVRGAIIKICLRKITVPERNSAIADAVVEALHKRGKFYYDEGSRDFATTMYFDSAAAVLYLIGSDIFRAWLSEWIAINRSDNVFKFIMTAVEDAALSGDKTVGITPENYWTSREGAVYLSNGDGKVMKITATKIEEVDNGTDGVLFSCGKTLSPWKLTEPEDPFLSCDLFRNMDCSAPHGKDLLRVWVMSLPLNPKCKPPLALAGDVGSGKTRAATGIAELYGIPPNVVKASEKNDADFWPGVNQGGLFVLDNVDTRIKWLPDTLAACSTNGTSIRRKLYCNSETVVMRPRAWLAVTSANPEFASDAGLADRLLPVRLNRRTGNTSDSLLSEQIERNRSTGLSFIVLAIQRSLGDVGPTPEKLNARHPDFAAHAVRLGRAIGREREVILALRAAESDKAVLCLENDPVGSMIALLIKSNHVLEGTAADIFSQIKCSDMTGFGRMTSGKGAKRLTALWPHLEAVYDTEKRIVHGGALHYRIAERGWVGPTGDGGDIEKAISLNLL